jgi:hypothetical protein
MNSRACSSVIVRLGRPPSIRACLAARPPTSGRLAEVVNALISSLVASPDLSSGIGFHGVANDLVHLVQLDPPPGRHGQDRQCLGHLRTRG